MRRRLKQGKSCIRIHWYRINRGNRKRQRRPCNAIEETVPSACKRAARCCGPLPCA
ncbi:hypothetical protein COCC4DRAFT_169723 [Bipolaris maydis ATCC 48331]|uniref:Uncharacterized protein n=2 Tax=Cochliobolus heterostrophus TaxID=5016 RepID=M2U3B7_COCH5|nr:uncharacterized protein COCC4DRAFT_169723 [Bipolaris maydis ATCC 48331]EMD93054.1 hypothetical protein COCHEDRAFT_1193388 [Bipolaris maydis C5]ENI04556.1 hypothetical protein COCC4DRAFT_169723 [Bipolaris maydis ATCC 48331]